MTSEVSGWLQMPPDCIRRLQITPEGYGHLQIVPDGSRTIKTKESLSKTNVSGARTKEYLSKTIISEGKTKIPNYRAFPIPKTHR